MNMERRIISIEYGGENHEFVNVGGIVAGVGECTKIEEHPARGEGDKFYYDVHFVGGHIQRIFNMNYVWFDKE